MNEGFDKRLARVGYPSSPQLWPIEGAARHVGMSADLLEAGILRGEIPAALHRVGPSGKRFVNAVQVQAWLDQPPAAGAVPADENLFEGTHQ